MITYFDRKVGLKSGTLDFFDDSDEQAEHIHSRIKYFFKSHDVNDSNISALCADNTLVNFGVNNSIFQKLQKDHPNIIKANWNCHVLHNMVKYARSFLKYDIET